ncbi:unnamed protein product [Thlaspi arvense]|uniref:F-box domain-containing protein n=1 Tax=Thlaspi arvense TaxID=13288 RepID=A0AAU9SBR3_THLAR|nr:unnamed protein product [Thlaspi arvense]
MAEPETEKKTLPVMLHCSLLSDYQSSSPPAKIATKERTLSIPNWSHLPEELLHIISTHLKDCFDVLHARSVCQSWRSTFPFPACLLSPSYSLPSYATFPLESKESCTTLKKIPLFLIRITISPGASAAAPGYLCFLGGLGKGTELLLPSPTLQCSVKVKIPGFLPTVRNMLDCEIVTLGHQYRMIGWELRDYRGVVFLPLNKEGEFVVLINYTNILLVLTSAEMKWKQLKNVPDASFSNLIAFRGRFYAAFRNREVVVIDPCSLDVTPLMPSQPEPLSSTNYLVPSGDDDELFLVELIIPTFGDSHDHPLTCRVSKLDEETCRWVVVNHLGDRVLFIGFFGNVSCFAKDLPDGCGVSGNSILFTNGICNVTFSYKYVAGSAEDGFSLWRMSRENRVRIVNRSPVVALRLSIPDLPPYLKRNTDFGDRVLFVEIDAQSDFYSCPYNKEEIDYNIGFSVALAIVEMAEPARKKNTPLLILDWTKLPEEILELISEKLGYFNVVHVRSVCRSWRKIFPLPSCLVLQTFSLPTYPIEKVGVCSVEKIPIFLFKVQRAPADSATSALSTYYVGAINRDECGDYMEPPSPLQGSLRVMVSRSDPKLVNMVDCEVFSMSHQYRMICWDPKGLKTIYKHVAYLPLHKKGEGESVVLGGCKKYLPLHKNGEGEFVVLRGCKKYLLFLTSAERKWKRFKEGWVCTSVVTFRGKFYVTILSKGVFVIDPYTMKATQLMPSPGVSGANYLVPSGNDELFLVERLVISAGRITCRVFRMDEEVGGWVAATDLGGGVLFCGHEVNFCCSAEKLPDGCGVTGDSVLFTNHLKDVTYFYKYKPPPCAAEGVGSEWIISRESRVKFVKSRCPSVAFQVDLCEE